MKAHVPGEVFRAAARSGEQGKVLCHVDLFRSSHRQPNRIMTGEKKASCGCSVRVELLSLSKAKVPVLLLARKKTFFFCLQECICRFLAVSAVTLQYSRFFWYCKNWLLSHDPLVSRTYNKATKKGTSHRAN